MIVPMDPLDRLAEIETQGTRRFATHDRGEHREGTVLHEDPQITDLHLVQRSASLDAERIGDEVSDRRQHPGDHVGVLGLHLRRRHVSQHESGLAMNQKQLFDPEDEAVQERDLRE